MTRPLDCRFVAIEPDTAQTLEDLGEELLRAGDRRGSALLALYLAWLEAPTVQRIEFDYSVRVDADGEGRDVAARTLRLVEGETG